MDATDQRYVMIIRLLTRFGVLIAIKKNQPQRSKNNAKQQRSGGVMGVRTVKLRNNDSVAKCPKCKNNTDFEAHAEQVCEDCCEIWVVCKCGFDPTQEHPIYRVEDIWGSLDQDTVTDAVYSWTEVIKDKYMPKEQQNDQRD